MSDFSADWLTLREAADHGARDPGSVQILAGWARTGDPLRILDLGAGTGSNLRYLAPRLDVDQDWRLLDHSAEMLSVLPDALSRWVAGRGDLLTTGPNGLEIRLGARRLEVDWSLEDLAALATGDGLGDADLVTASALLDLTSADWIEGLAERCVQGGSAALFALTYDGRVQWCPSLPDDARVTDLLNRHQLQDKGLGTALGPGAADQAEACFVARGYRVTKAPSDWQLGPEARELQEALAQGWAQAALEMEPTATDWSETWLESRIGHCRGGGSWLTVGHQDLLALPPLGPRSRVNPLLCS